MNVGNNDFSIDRFEQMILFAKNCGYTFRTMKQYLDEGCPNHTFIIKHDLDAKPTTLKNLLDVQKKCDVRSTIYARVTANDYNLMDYKTLPMLVKASKEGFEVGLHTNCVEYAEINDLDPMQVLKAEVNLLKSFINIEGMSTHRDFNYSFNALPWVEQNWDLIKEETGLSYQAYDQRFMNSKNFYVNEGMKRHLTWENLTPEQAIMTRQTVVLLTHPHWWWVKHPFETW